MMNKKATEQGNPMQCGSGATCGSNSVVQDGSLDMKAEWRMGKVSHGTDLKDDDEDFVIPAEHFGKTKPRQMQSKGGKVMDVKFVGLGNERVDKTTKEGT
ncbi:hypothetical protein DCAR_0205793 [Daucus carota subsp. sativus]|uniref:Uncharacterized protein n=1 Tax=Daucus carota subsp. sativus TaxID=79200 RepID=A0A166CTN2_DAUCS|nr:hypothetical protein DCAR_0205793 [Daucus carota subsp. sativus]